MKVSKKFKNGDFDMLSLQFSTAGGADGAVAGMESYRELRHSLTSFIDAMRDFLSNIGIAERTSNVDGDDNDSSGDDSGNFFD